MTEPFTVSIGDKFKHNSIPDIVVVVCEITPTDSGGYKWVVVKTPDGTMWPEKVIDLAVGYQRVS
jgi:hypothetical protein